MSLRKVHLKVKF